MKNKRDYLYRITFLMGLIVNAILFENHVFGEHELVVPALVGAAVTLVLNLVLWFSTHDED